MPGVRVLRLQPYKGGGFLSELGKVARPLLLSLARNVYPMVKSQLKNVGAKAIRDGAELLTSTVLAESDAARKKEGGGGAGLSLCFFL